MTSPTTLSLKLLREEGYTAQVVERWNMFAKRRIDLFGFIDIVAVHPKKTGILGVQTTSRANQSTRLIKSRDCKTLEPWLQAQNSFEVHGWAKNGPRGKLKTWQVVRSPIKLEEI